MKIIETELLQFQADEAMHVHPELWVRVVSDQPLDWKEHWASVWESLPAGTRINLAEEYAVSANVMSFNKPCLFWVHEWPDDEPVTDGFEQTWCFPMRTDKRS